MSSSPASRSNTGPWIIVFLVVTLLVVHQDNWFWTDGRLVFGIIPIGLFYHACISIAASATWFLASKIAWPLESLPLKSAPLNQSTDDDNVKSEVSR